MAGNEDRIGQGEAALGQAVLGQALRGRGLRFVLVDQLRQHGTMTVAEMVTVLDASGYVLDGRASKLISDSLRWELARGRVKRLSRGVYTYGRVPASTSRRIGLFAARCQAWIDAGLLDEQPPLTPSTPEHRKAHGYWYNEHPLRPPWAKLTWLWST